MYKGHIASPYGDVPHNNLHEILHTDGTHPVQRAERNGFMNINVPACVWPRQQKPVELCSFPETRAFRLGD
jgi:hypothetical protein